MKTTTAAHQPIIIALVILSIVISTIVNNTIRPLFNEAVRRYKHHIFVEARRKEFYSGLSAIMSSAQTPGHRG